MNKMKVWFVVYNNCNYTIGYYHSYEKAENHCIKIGYAKIKNEYFVKKQGMFYESLSIIEKEITKESHPMIYLTMTTEY